MAVRISMALDGARVDPEGRALVAAHRDPRRPDAAPPDLLVLSPDGAVLERFRSGTRVEEARAALRQAAARHAPDLPGPLPPPGDAEALYQAGLDAWRDGDAEAARAAWDRLLEAHPDHALRHRVRWHHGARVLLPPHPDLAGAELPEPPPEVPWPDVRRANLAAVADLPAPAGLPFVLVPAGTFTMGGSPAQKPAELPHRQVTLSRPYRLSVWPVPRGVWHRVMAPASPPPEGLAADLPRASIPYDEAEAFCARLTALADDGWRYRVPTEAEWERAARGGLGGATFPWGNDPIDPTRACYDRAWPVPVGCYPPNAYGLCDMVGNVPEWTADHHAGDAYGRTPAEITDPTGPEPDPEQRLAVRVVRGGGTQRAFLALMCRNSRRLAAPERLPPCMAVGLRVAAHKVS